MNKKGISNQTLVALVFLALVVAIGGTFVSLSKLRAIEITGFTSTPTGVVNVSTVTATDISLIVDSVSFGSLQADSVNSTLDDDPAPFNVSNDGNVCVNITLTRDNSSWFTGTTAYNDTMFNVTCGTTSTCLTLLTDWTDLNTTAVNALAHLNYTNGKDSAEVHIYIHVPSDETGGGKNTTVTFTASDSGKI